MLLACVLLQSSLSWTLRTQACTPCFNTGKSQSYKGYWLLLNLCAQLKKKEWKVETWAAIKSGRQKQKPNPKPNNLYNKGVEQVSLLASSTAKQRGLSVSLNSPPGDKGYERAVFESFTLGLCLFLEDSPWLSEVQLHQKQESGQGGLWCVSWSRTVWMVIFFYSFSSSKILNSQRLFGWSKQTAGTSCFLKLRWKFSF